MDRTRRSLLQAGLADALLAPLPLRLGAADTGAPGLTPRERWLLELAARAPSGHNTQPWLLHRLAPERWRLGLAADRLLPVVDPAARESWISLGCFLAHLEIAAAHAGLACLWQWAEGAPAQIEIGFAPQAARAQDLDALRLRRTLKRELADRPITAPLWRGLAGGIAGLHFLPRGGPQAAAIAEATIAANEAQARRDAAMRELGEWIRWSDADAARSGTGLSLEGLEIPLAARWALRLFYGPGAVTSPSFRRETVDTARSLASQGAGWIALASAGDAPPDWLAAGRELARLWLRLRAAGLGLHPMSQALEEPAQRRALAAGLGLGPLQMLARIGFRAAMPPPVSLRLPPERFIVPA